MRPVCRLAISLCLLPACSLISAAQSWQAPTLYPAGVDAITRIATADLQGLQSNDALAITAANNLELFANDGAGHLSSTAQPVRGNVTAVAAAKFSGSLMDDLLVISSATPSAPLQLMLLPSQGGRTFGTAVAIAPQLNLGATCQLYAADFNGDGVPDVLIFCSGFNNLLIGTNDGKGDFSFATIPSFLDSGRVIQNVAPADLDGDGLADIVVQSSSTYSPTVSRVDVLWNSAAGTFSQQLNYISQSDASALYVTKLDGHPVANLVTGSGGGVSVFTDEANRALLTQSTALEIPSGCSVTSLSSGRMINIKYSLGQDMVAAATCNGQNQLLVFQNAAQTTLTVTPTLSAAGGVPAISLMISAASSSGTVIPTGTVNVKLGTATLQQTLANGSAELNPQPSQGANMLQVSYSGDINSAGASQAVDIVLTDNTTPTGSTPSFVINGPTITPASNLLVGSPYTVTAAVQQTSSGNPNVLTAPSGSITFSDNGVAIATMQGVSSESLSPWANSDCSLNGSQWVGTQCAPDGSGSYPIAYEQDTNNFTSLVTFPTSGSNLVAATFIPAGQSSATGTTQSQMYQVASTSQAGAQTSPVVSAGLMSPSFSRLSLKPMAATQLPASGIINTVAGNGTTSDSGDGGAATSAGLSYPQGVAIDSSGNIYIADGGIIRKVTISTGVISTVSTLALSAASGVTFDSSGNMYIADQGHNRILKIAAGTGVTSTVAGNGAVGNSGDGGLATSAELRNPNAVAVDPSGNIYIADGGNYSIRKVTATTGDISTIEAGLPGIPTGVALDSTGHLYIADDNEGEVFTATTSGGTLSIVAGNGTAGFSGDGGLATSAALESPYDVAVDGYGNLYISDFGNNNIRKVTASTGIISTIAGNRTQGFSGDGGSATSAELYNPTGVAVDSTGNIYIADLRNYRIRVIGEPKLTPTLSVSCSPNTITYPTQTSTCTATLSGGTGSYSGTLQAFYDGNGWCSNSGVSTISCTGWNGEPAGTHTFSATYSGDSGNSTVSNSTSLTIVKGTPAISVSCSPNTSAFDSQQGPLTTCTVSVGNGATGTVAFYYNGTYWTTPTLSGSTASASGFDYGTAIGTYNIVANYSGDSNNNPTSGSASFVVTPANTISQLSSSVNPSSYGQSVSFTSLVNTGGIAPTGTVTFQNGGTSFGTASVSTVSATNIFAESVDMTQSAWNLLSAYAVTKSAGIAPDGTNTAIQLVVNGSDPFIGEAVNEGTLSNQAFTISVWVKGIGSTIGKLAQFYLFDGNAQSINGCNTSLITGAWSRVTCTVTFPSGITSPILQARFDFPGQSNQTIGDTVLVWGPQVEQSSQTGPYVATTSASASGYGGVATLTTSSLPGGSDSITAIYGGDTNDATSTSPPLTQTVTAAAPTLSVASSGSPSLSGASVTFTSTISSGPTGTITFYDGGASIGTGAISGTTATFTTSSLAVGTHSITAGWAGNADYIAVTSSAISQVVNSGSQTITFTPPTSPVIYGVSPIALSATSTSGLTVAFSVLSGPGTISGSTLTITGAGTVVVAANQAGDANYLAATQVTQSVVVNQAAPTISWATPAAITYGTALSGTQLNATSGGVAGTFVYTPAAGTMLAAGAQTLSVTFTPSDSTDYTTATGSTTLTVSKAAVGISISSTVNPSNYGATVTFTFTFTGVAGGAVPTGLAQITDGASILGTLTLNSSGVATITTSTLVAGTHSITAAYQGDSNYH